MLQTDIDRAAGGDGAAYARIVGAYQQAVARRMMRFGRNRADVEELVQEVFVEAYFSLGGYRSEAPFEHWLQRIATRVGYRYWKRRQRERREVAGLAIELEQVAAAGDERAIDAADAAELLRGVLDRLPPRDRLVITLLHVEGRSVEEAARLSGWSRTMVKVQAYRARAKLRRLLESTAPSGRRKGDDHG
ncbi:MAG: RNA polymerase sigma factor [Tepidisphaeraceae bacterium]